MKWYPYITILVVVLTILATGYPFRPLYIFFQKGYYDTAWVDTTDFCLPCSTSFDIAICTTLVLTDLPSDTIHDTIWHGYILQLWIKDTSGYISDTYYVNDTCFQTLYPVMPCDMAPACSLTWGYHLWIINLYCICATYGICVMDGDSICARVIRGARLGQKCIGVSSSHAIHKMRVIAIDTTTFHIKPPIYNESQRNPDTFWYDIKGRKVLPASQGLYIHKGKVLILTK